ncbi:sensor histidine kinase, partial [Halorussus sp. GCM10023401]
MFRRSDERSVARSVGPLRSWSVVGLGVGLLAVSGSYFFVDAALDATELVRLGIPVGVSLLVVALGTWLRTSALSARRVGAVFVWSVAGGIVMGLLSGWVTVLQAMEGRPMVRPASIVLTEVALGALGGGLLGVYHGRLRRRTEQLAEERNRLDEFAGIVSHDLRNPLNVAQGHLELACETGRDESFEAVADAHGRMERLVEEVLALSRRGRTVADAESVSVGSVAREAWATVETRGMELRVETDREVVADARRLRALFENLFRNAVEHGIEDGSADDRAGAVV